MLGFGKVLKRSIGDSYEYLGLMLLCSFTWLSTVIICAWIIRSIISANPLGVIVIAGLLAVLAISPMTAGVFYVARQIVVRDEPSAGDLFRGFVRLMPGSWVLGASQIAITLVLLWNAWFYLSRGFPLGILGLFVIYLLLGWGMSCLYHYPILIEQNPGVIKILRRSFLLVLGSPAFTCEVFIAIIVLTCLCMATLFGLPLLYAGMASVLQTRATRALLIKYEVLPPEPEPTPIPDDEWKVPDD